MLKIQKQLNQQDDTSVIGPKYNEKYKAFFKKAEDEFIASAGTPNTILGFPLTLSKLH